MNTPANHSANTASHAATNASKNYCASTYLLGGLFFIFTLVLFNFHGSSDVDRFWLNWMSLLAEHGFRDGFDAIWADYPPLSIFMLHLVQLSAQFFAVEPFIPLKLSVLFFLWWSFFQYHKLCGDIVLTSGLGLALVLSAAILVYLDIYYTPFLLLSLYALQQQRPLAATIWFGVCCSIKYQPLIIAPFFAVAIYQIYLNAATGDAVSNSANGNDLKKIALKQSAQTLLIPAALTLLLMYLVVGWPLFTSMYNALTHGKISFQALNIHWIYANFLSEWHNQPLRRVDNASTLFLYGSRGVFLLFYAVLLYRFWQRKHFSFEYFLLFAIAGYYSYFVLVSGVHENHLYIAAILASVIYIFYPAQRPLALFIILMNNINLLVFNGINGTGLPFALDINVLWMTLDSRYLLAALNSLFYFYIFIQLAMKNNALKG